MFQIRHFRSQLFHVNKFINGKGLFSNWQRLCTIYGGQFSAIQSGNVRSCTIQSKFQEFCKRNHFCCGNNDDIHLLPGESAKYPTIPSPKIPTNYTINQKQRSAAEETEKSVNNHADLETRWLGLDIYNKKHLRLILERGKSGQKFFQITLCKHIGQYYKFANIIVPLDAYAFVRALDELIEETAAENFEQKLQIQDLKSTSEIANDSHKTNRKFKLKTVEFIGQYNKFHLELILYINTNRGIMEKTICLRLFAVEENNTYETTLILPLLSLPWLRSQMAEMLAKHDGTEQIVKEAPAKIPQKFLGVSHPHLTSNGIPIGQKFEHKGMQPQFAIKNSSTFQHPKKQNFDQSGNKKQKMTATFPMQQRPKQSKMDEEIIANLILEEEGDELLLDPLIAASGRKIRPLFDFEEDYEEKYRRLAEKRNIPFQY